MERQLLEKFEVLREVTMKITVSWDVTPYGLKMFTDISKECATSIFRVKA
jgi:hypothetical protein